MMTEIVIWLAKVSAVTALVLGGIGAVIAILSFIAPDVVAEQLARNSNQLEALVGLGDEGL